MLSGEFVRLRGHPVLHKPVGIQLHSAPGTEMPVKVSGFKQPIDDAKWTITTLTHTVNPDSGFTTSLDLEVKIDEFEIE